MENPTTGAAPTTLSRPKFRPWKKASGASLGLCFGGGPEALSIMPQREGGAQFQHADSLRSMTSTDLIEEL